MRLGVAQGRLKFQLVQTFWNIKPWMFGGNSSRKHLCQLPTSSSGARMGSTVNKDFKISWILKLHVKDGSQWVCEHPFATVRTKVTFFTAQEHTVPRAFPRIISFNPHHRPVGGCEHHTHCPVEEMDSKSLSHLPKVTVSDGASTHIWIACSFHHTCCLQVEIFL